MAVVLILVGTFVQIRLQMGLLWMGVITVDGRRARFGDLFAKPHLFWRFLCPSILFQLMVMAGFILLIVPGIYLLARFLPLSFVLMDRETGVLESFRQAQRLTEGHRGKLTAVIFLGYALAFGLFMALSVTAFTVGGSALLVMPIVMLFGVFVFTPIVAPIILLSLAALYRALKNASAHQGAPA